MAVGVAWGATGCSESAAAVVMAPIATAVAAALVGSPRGLVAGEGGRLREECVLGLFQLRLPGQALPPAQQQRLHGAAAGALLAAVGVRLLRPDRKDLLHACVKVVGRRQVWRRVPPQPSSR